MDIIVKNNLHERISDSDVIEDWASFLKLQWDDFFYTEEETFLKQIEEVGHRLEIWGDMGNNIMILKDIVELY